MAKNNAFSIEDTDFEDLTDNLGADQIEESDYHEYDTLDVEGGKNHATEKEVIEAEQACDPGAATEAYIGSILSLSKEDMDAVADDIVEEAEANAEETAVMEDGEEGDGNNDVVVENSEDETTVKVEPECDDDCEVELTVTKEPEDDDPTSVAATESFRRLMGLEDVEDPDNDVNLTVDVPGESNYDIGIDGQAVTLEPGDVTGDDDVPDLGGEEPAAEPTTDDSTGDDVPDLSEDGDTGGDAGGDAGEEGDNTDDDDSESGESLTQFGGFTFH